MSKTTVVNMRGGTLCDVYVGRATRKLWASPLANPFRIGPDGDRAEVIEKYRVWINAPEQAHLRRHLPHLRGKRLGCWCAPPGGLTADDPLVCHGQILAQLADALPVLEV